MPQRQLPGPVQGALQLPMPGADCQPLGVARERVCPEQQRPHSFAAERLPPDRVILERDEVHAHVDANACQRRRGTSAKGERAGPAQRKNVAAQR